MYPGFESLVGSMNRVLDSFGKPLSDLHKIMGHMAVNDFSIGMPSDYAGEFKTLADSTNTVRTRLLSAQDAFQKIAIGNFDRIEEFRKVGRRSENDHLVPSILATMETLSQYIKEMDRVSMEYNAGNIDVRMPAEKFQGAYRSMSDGVNRMVDSQGQILQKSMACIKEFGGGNFEAPLERFPGKVAFINEIIEQVRSNLKALKADTDFLCKAAVEGRLTVRADPSKNPGDFGKIIQGINATLDSVIGPLNTAAKYVDDISKGIVPGKITQDYNGDFNIIKNNLNQCIDGLGGLVEANAVLQRMSINDYSVKVNSNYSGIFNEVAVAVNQVQGRIEHVVETLSKISDGDLSDLENYRQIGNGIGRRSQNDRLVPSLIKLMENLKALIADADMLAKAAVEGKLNSRADATRHRGDYQKIVQGVNDTLDAVIGPIQEAMRIAESYADGDLTARVNIDAKGDFAAFATSLDKIGESMCDMLREVNSSANMVSSTSQELASSAEEMNASTEQVSSAIQQISKGAQDQAAQVDETAKTMAGVSKTVDATQSRSVKAAADARNTSQRANAGVTTVENTIKKMQEIQKVVVESAKVIESLGKRSEEIGEIVSVITHISDQTNLLALNAAIEAARAGTQGRGFAVVAEEVKNLAEDSREAAERIAKMIKEVQSETAKAVESMHRGTKETAEGMEHVEMTGRAFREISQMASSFEETMNAFQADMVLQKEGALKAASAIDSISSVAEETASSAEESSASTEELTASMEDMTARAQALSEMAVNLQKMAGQFRIDEGDEVQAASPPKPVAPVRSNNPGAGKTLVRKNPQGIPSKVKAALDKRGITTTSG